MRYKAHSMLPPSLTYTFASNNVWFVDSGASNHMTLRKLDRLDYVETGDDTTHPIQHVRNVPFRNDDKQTCLKNVLHVSTITKNLVSVGQIVEQDMQVQFKHEGCFMEKHDRLVARGRREGQMFILDSNEVKSSMFAKYLKVNTDLEVCHKRIDHINFQKLQSMKAKGVVVRLSTFTEKGSTGVCEACQFGKQCQHPFPNERNVSKGVLDVVHSDA